MTQENHSSGAIVTGDNSKEEILLKGSTAHIDLAQEIKNLLRVLGTKELNLENVEQPSMALWWDNKGTPNETMVLAVGIDDKDDLYLTLDDGCGADVQIWESCGQLSDNDLEPILENIREYMGKPSKMSFQELAERAFALPIEETIPFFCKESLDDYAWGITKTRQLEADLIVVGIYGGGMTFMYDLTGDPDAGELAGFLHNILTIFTQESVWLKPRAFCTKGAAGAAEKFYSALSVNNRRKLVDRACTVYDGDSQVTIDPTLPQKPKVSGILNMLTGVLNDWWNYQDYETRQSISNLTDEGFGSLDEHDRAMNDNWKRLLVEEKLTLWRQFWNKNESDMAPELLTKISSHLHNLTQIDQHNDLSLIFMDEQKRHEIDMQPWIDEWHACECDFAAWFAKLPAGMQARVVEYYKNFNE